MVLVLRGGLPGNDCLAFSVLVLTTLLVGPLHATVDEIRIVRGSLDQTLDRIGVLDVEGTNGVRIEAALPSIFASLEWGLCDLLSCLPGDVIGLGAAYVLPIGGAGQVTIHGQTYSFGMADGASADLEFDGAFVLPDFTDTDLELSAPFTFSGSLQVPSQQESGTDDVFELQGSGVATVLIVPHPFETSLDCEPRAVRL
jgi:hypothetical protein